MLRGNQGISPASSEKAVTNESGHEGNKDWYFCIQTHSVTSIRSLRSQSIDHSVHNFVCIRAGILGNFTNSLFDCEKRKKDIDYGLNILACRTSATFTQFQSNGCKREESARRGRSASHAWGAVRENMSVCAPPQSPRAWFPLRACLS